MDIAIQNVSATGEEPHHERGPDVGGDLLVHVEQQESGLLLVLSPAARRLDLLLQTALPLPPIWGSRGQPHSGHKTESEQSRVNQCKPLIKINHS